MARDRRGLSPAARAVRLAGLPLGYAGRTALGLGKRLGGQPALDVTAEIQQRTAEHMFRTLGNLKGGAMKVGQALSVLEAALPEELVAPYREKLTALQDSAPPMAEDLVRDQLRAGLGPEWELDLVEFDPQPTAAASIGQVHRGVWSDGTEVAVKIQYPDAESALLGDLRQLGRLARTVAPVFPGIDIRAVVAELKDRAGEELNYHLEADAQRRYADAFEDHPHFVIPDVVSVSKTVLVTEWMDSTGSLASIIENGTEAERDHYGTLLARFLFEGPALTGMLHADPHPGNFRILPGPDGEPGKLGVLDFGAVARLSEGAMPWAMGHLLRAALGGDDDALEEGLRDAGFIRPQITVDPQVALDYLAPFVEPAATETFRFSREWMRGQFERINDTSDPGYTMALKFNLPTEYVLIHRTWLGGIGLLSQLGAEAPFRAILMEFLPGFDE